jgi:hypothetical protein
MKFVSVKAVASYVKDIFKQEMEISDVIRICSEALKLLKVFAIDNYIVVDRIDDFKIHLPGVYKVQSVSRLDNPVSAIHIEVQDIVHPPQIVFQVPAILESPEPASFKANYINQIKGPYMDFKWNCPCLEFNETDIQVLIEVVGVKKDADGYPMIPELAFYACAYYCLYVYQLPLMLLGKIQAGAFDRIENIKNNKFGQARADMLMDALNKNEVDKLADIMSSMDRKHFNIAI